ncbi:hypothetical protein IAU59_003967 [Kwoniella sp. CBS 9459]
MSNEHENRQLGGLKATVHNPNTSPEAKAHATEILAEHGITLKADPPTAQHGQHGNGHGHSHSGHGHAHAHVQAHGHAHAHETRSHDNAKKEEEHEHRVMGGYKAALHNPNVSEDAKEHAQQILQEHGANNAA